MIYDLDLEVGLFGRGDKHARHHITQTMASTSAIDSDELKTEMEEWVAALRAGMTEHVHFILVRAKQIHILKTSPAYKDHRAFELAGVGARNAPEVAANADGTVPSPLILDGHVLRIGKEAKKNRPGMMSLRGALLVGDVEGDPAGGYTLTNAAAFTGAGKLIPLLNAGCEATKGTGQGYCIASGPKYSTASTVRFITHFDIEGVGRLQETHGHTSASQARQNGLIRAIKADIADAKDIVGEAADAGGLSGTDLTIFNAIKARFAADWAALGLDGQKKIKDIVPAYLL